MDTNSQQNSSGAIYAMNGLRQVVRVAEREQERVRADPGLGASMERGSVRSLHRSNVWHGMVSGRMGLMRIITAG